MKTSKGFDAYEAEYYDKIFEGCDIVKKGLVTAPDAHAMKRELAFFVLSPVNDAREGYCFWLPYGKVMKNEHRNWLEQQVVLVKVPERLQDALEYMIHLTHAVMGCVDPEKAS